MKRLFLLPVLFLYSCSSEVAIPNKGICRANGRNVTTEVARECLVKGLSYTQVAQVLGDGGTRLQQSEKAQMWSWAVKNGAIFVFLDKDGKVSEFSVQG